LKKTTFSQFTNNLRAAFAPIFFQQKITNQNFKNIKVMQNTNVQKDACKMMMEKYLQLISPTYYEQHLYQFSSNKN